VQVLLASQLAINTGFFVLYPYLAGHLQRELGLSAGVLGLVLGIGTLSQQGLFLVGGTLSDRLGPRPAIIGGLLIRSIGFLAFAFASSLPLLIVAAFLSGFAGALFNPAVRAYLAHAAGPRRVEAFALFGVFANAGLLLGPVVGGFLVQLDFVVAGVSAAALFVCLAVVQARVLPPAQLGGEPDVRRPVLNDWRAALRNRPFVLFALGMLGYFALYVQFYLALPLAARRATPDELGVSSIFVLSAVLGIVAQVPVTAWSERHWTPPRAIAIGLLVMGGAFAFMCAWTALPIGNVVLLQLGSVLAATAVLTFGTLIAQPFALDLTVSLAHTPRLIGTYFAFYYLSLGIGGAAGNVLAGWSFDVAHTLGLDALPWLVLASIGLGSAAVVLGLERRGLLTAPQELR
jgi:predicted MFS family arabinose efflux permease